MPKPQPPHNTLNQPNPNTDPPLRPTRLDQFTGQNKIKERLQIAIQATLQRKDTLDHTLLTGPPGLGKTTLAHIIAKTLNTNLRATSGPTIEKAADLAGILTNLQPNDILFIDEIHRLQKNIEEYLYPAMEDYTLDIIIDQGPNARTIRLNLPHFTLIGATTRSGLITPPLLSRFPIRERLNHYNPQQLQHIITRSAQLLKIQCDTQGAHEIAKRSRGTPRIANNLLRRVRDYAQVRSKGNITQTIADQSLQLLEIDEHGLDPMDKNILQTIIHKFHGGPVGINSLAVALNEEPNTIEEVYEPYLIMQGYIKRTPQGRTATPATYHKLHITPPQKQQNNLL